MADSEFNPHTVLTSHLANVARLRQIDNRPGASLDDYLAAFRHNGVPLTDEQKQLVLDLHREGTSPNPSRR